MKRESKIRSLENGVHISIDVLFPVTHKEGEPIDEETLRRAGRNFMLDVFGTYQEYLIKVLDNRMQACVNNLFNHRDDVVYNDGNQIVYNRKDGSVHGFNVPSYLNMEDCLWALEHQHYGDILENRVWCDQLLKAICNEREIIREDKGKIKFSDLVSILCEIHAMPSGSDYDIDTNR